jgi:hypothetical protein
MPFWYWPGSGSHFDADPPVIRTRPEPIYQLKEIREFDAKQHHLNKRNLCEKAKNRLAKKKTKRSCLYSIFKPIFTNKCNIRQCHIFKCKRKKIIIFLLFHFFYIYFFAGLKCFGHSLLCRPFMTFDFYTGGFFIYVIQQCCICRPSVSTVSEPYSEDPGIKPRALEALALTTRLNLIHLRLLIFG